MGFWYLTEGGAFLGSRNKTASGSREIGDNVNGGLKKNRGGFLSSRNDDFSFIPY